MKNVGALKIAGVYIGTVVGAGFATGQEVLQFFSRFGISGIWGIALATALFIIYGYIIIALGLSLGASSHLEVLMASCGTKIGRVMDFIVTFFLFGAITAMFAGTGALFEQQWGLPMILGCGIMAIITAVTVLTGIKGVLNSISFVAPFLIVTVVGICVYSIVGGAVSGAPAAQTNPNPLINNWMLSSILYVSYNILLSIAVLGPLGAQAKGRKAIFWGAFLGGLGLGITSLMIYLALNPILATAHTLEVPLAFIAGNISAPVAFIFTIVLIAEVYTTAVGGLFGFASRLNAGVSSTGRRGRRPLQKHAGDSSSVGANCVRLTSKNIIHKKNGTLMPFTRAVGRTQFA
ncbi:MAG: hypothetical protein FWE47_03120, partial [Oscillospiraceae bacterium]|nr:hypothetical protein [Oscillospiraceae bacterium]